MRKDRAEGRASKAYAREHARLTAALGELTEGGAIEGIAHIGATSVPGLSDAGCVDVGLAVWPHRLEAPLRVAVERLGYGAEPARDGAQDERFVHESGRTRLFVTECGSERWTDYRLLRDYMRHSADARQAFAAGKARVGATARDVREIAREKLFAEAVDSARRWHIAYRGFGPVEAVASEMDDLPAPWCISSGWALDLFLGHVTRVHHDVDVTLARDDQIGLQQYMTQRGWKWMTPLDGRLEPWPPHMRIELPRHQAHAHRSGEFIDFPISEIRDGIWRFRRNQAIVRATEDAVLRTAGGLPFLAPEIVLLYKSKDGIFGRAKDHADFAAAQGRLEPAARAWLRWALTVMDAKHPWIEALE